MIRVAVESIDDVGGWLVQGRPPEVAAAILGLRQQRQKGIIIARIAKAELDIFKESVAAAGADAVVGDDTPSAEVREMVRAAAWDARPTLASSPRRIELLRLG